MDIVTFRTRRMLFWQAFPRCSIARCRLWSSKTMAALRGPYITAFRGKWYSVQRCLSINIVRVCFQCGMQHVVYPCVRVSVQLLPTYYGSAILSPAYLFSFRSHSFRLCATSFVRLVKERKKQVKLEFLLSSSISQMFEIEQQRCARFLLRFSIEKLHPRLRRTFFHFAIYYLTTKA